MPSGQGYMNDVNNTISVFDVYTPESFAMPVYGGEGANGAPRGGNGNGSAAAPAAASGPLGKPANWWVGLVLTFAVFVFVARRYAGDDRYSNIRLSLYNGLFLTFFIVIILNFLKVVAGRFFPNSAPGQLILAA